jgi:hypothetical protein
MAIVDDPSAALDAIANDILAASTQKEKYTAIMKAKRVIAFKTTEELKRDREEQFRSKFTWFVIGLYVVTTGCIFYLIFSAFQFDLRMIELRETYTRLIDAKVVIGLITGVVLQAGAAFAILAKFVYHQDKIDNKGDKTDKKGD